MVNQDSVRIDPEIHNLIPPLSSDELDLLEASVLAEGIRDALVVWAEERTLLDGHHRYILAQKHGLTYRVVERSFSNREDAVEWVMQNQLGRRNLTDNQRAYLLGKLYEARKRCDGRPEKRDNSCHVSGRTRASIAEETNVSEGTIQNATQFARSVDALDEIAPGYKQATLIENRVTQKDTMTLAKIADKDPDKTAAVAEKIITGMAENVGQAIREVRRAEIAAKLAKLAFEEPETHDGLYDVIVIDPPWPIQKIERDCRPNQVGMDYLTMSLEEIALLSIPAAGDCHVWLWTTHRFLLNAFDLLNIWGLKYVCCLTWCKDGGFQPYGLPQYSSEFVLYARAGSPQFISTKDFSTWFTGKRREHSRKPDEFYETITRVTAGRRLDMFSRETRPGWKTWGNEPGKFDGGVEA